jgi:transcriptional regulator with XRE-family HTH domain
MTTAPLAASTLRQPNTVLRAIRISLRMSQEDLARCLRQAGERLEDPNEANKRLVQRWEDGSTRSPRPAYVRVLEVVTGLPVSQLGFDVPHLPEPTPDGHGGYDLHTSSQPLPAPVTTQPGRYSGVWLSRYEYYSSGRAASLANLRFVVVLQQGDQLVIRGLPGEWASDLTLTLAVDGTVATGTWVEVTEKDGYYRGARYHGAIQLIIDPTGRRMAGKWVGFGKDLEVNSGPWDFAFRDPSTSKGTLEQYSVAPDPDSVV